MILVNMDRIKMYLFISVRIFSINIVDIFLFYKTISIKRSYKSVS